MGDRNEAVPCLYAVVRSSCAIAVVTPTPIKNSHSSIDGDFHENIANGSVIKIANIYA